MATTATTPEAGTGSSHPGSIAGRDGRGRSSRVWTSSESVSSSSESHPSTCRAPRAPNAPATRRTARDRACASPSGSTRIEQPGRSGGASGSGSRSRASRSWSRSEARAKRPGGRAESRPAGAEHGHAAERCLDRAVRQRECLGQRADRAVVAGDQGGSQRTVPSPGSNPTVSSVPSSDLSSRIIPGLSAASTASSGLPRLARPPVACFHAASAGGGMRGAAPLK